MPDIRVPQQHQPGFLAIRNLEEDEFDSVLSTLRGIKPAERLPIPELERRVASAVPRLAQREGKAIIAALVSVQSARTIHGHSLTGFANGIAASDSLGLLPEEAAALASRIEALAEIPAIAIMAKALDIASEHDRTFHSARIITDIRPVFGEDATSSPLGAVVTHILRIDAFKDGMLQDYYVALDNKDIAALQAVVQRAIDKNASLNRVLDTIGFAQIQLAEEEE